MRHSMIVAARRVWDADQEESTPASGTRSNPMRALDRLYDLMGAPAARAIAEEAKAAAGVNNLEDPEQLGLFADALMRKGGVIEVVGRGIKIQAIFAGAKRSPAQAEAHAARPRRRAASR